jgi:hypothetical protein
MWPKSLLPQAMPWSRVMMVGYNASVILGASTGTVRTHAESLMNRLRSVRQDEVRGLGFGYLQSTN